MRRLRVLRTFGLSTIGLLSAVVYVGCTSPAPGRVNVPMRERVSSSGPRYQHEEMKPLPKPESVGKIPRPYEDPPLVSQKPPEQRAFLEAYERVGRPRLMIMAMGPDGSKAADHQYDLGAIDYAAVETILSDWLSANGAVSLISPRVATVTPAEPTTRPTPSPESDADILVRVQIHPGRSEVKEARLITEAVNTRGGDSLARAVVDVPAPLEKERLNEATRFVARKLMDEMTESWNRMNAVPRTPPSAGTSTEIPSRTLSSTAPTAPAPLPPPSIAPAPTPAPPPTIVIPPPNVTTAPAVRP
jgi:hypothetical protein